MTILVIGNSGSGKSEYAENLLLREAGEKKKYYIATMRILDREGAERVKRHRKNRQGKGFITVEQPRNLGAVAEQITENDAVLLECIANLTANEMFDREMRTAEAVAKKVLEEVQLLQRRTKTLIIVTSRYADTDSGYDEETRAYIRTLSAVNEGIANLADKVVEVREGVPKGIKG